MVSLQSPQKQRNRSAAKHQPPARSYSRPLAARRSLIALSSSSKRAGPANGAAPSMYRFSSSRQVRTAVTRRQYNISGVPGKFLHEAFLLIPPLTCYNCHRLFTRWHRVPHRKGAAQQASARHVCSGCGKRRRAGGTPRGLSVSSGIGTTLWGRRCFRREVFIVQQGRTPNLVEARRKRAVPGARAPQARKHRQNGVD